MKVRERRWRRGRRESWETREGKMTEKTQDVGEEEGGERGDK